MTLDLNAIRKRAEAATEGPWTNFDDSDYVDSTQVFQYDELTETNVDIVADCKRVWDAEFIAHARQDVPALIAEVERLQAESNSLCPIGDLDVISSLKLEKQLMSEQITELQAEVERLRSINDELTTINRLNDKLRLIETIIEVNESGKRGK